MISRNTSDEKWSKKPEESIAPPHKMSVRNICQEVKLQALPVNKVKEKDKKNEVVCHEQLPQPPFLITVVAPRKSGKTNLTVDLLLDEMKYCKKFDIILIWSRTFKHDSKWKNISLPEGSTTTHFDEYEAEDILRVAEEVAEKTVVNALWIFDDMITEGIMNARRMGALESIAVRGRHANVSIIIITQQYMALSPAIRNNSTNMLLFRIRNGNELEKVANENRESLSMKDFLTLYNYATAKPYGFMHVNNQQADPNKRFSIGWDNLLELREDRAKFDQDEQNASSIAALKLLTEAGYK